MRTALLIFSITLSGCATWFPAAVKDEGDGVYTITATGNSFASSEKMKQKLVRKAESLCGESGYSVKDDANTNWAKQKDYSTGMTTSYQQMRMTVECKDKTAK